MATTTNLGQLQYGDLTLLPGNDTTSSGFGNLAVAGTAFVGGASTTIAGTLSAAGATTLGSTLTVTGVSTFNDTVNITPTTTVGADVNPTASSGGTLNVNGDIVLGSATPRLYFPGASLGLPIFGTRSAGAKLVLYPGIGADTVDYSIGVETNIMWNAIPSASGVQSFRWYGGTTELMRLDGTGRLTSNSMAIVGTEDSSSTTTGAIVVPGGVGIGKSLWVGSVFNVAGNSTLQGKVSITDTSSSTSVATDNALNIAGGIYSVRSIRARSFLSNMSASVDGSSSTHLGLAVNHNNKWTFGLQGAESTGNVGSDLTLNRIDDAAALIDTVMRFTRSTGVVRLPIATLNSTDTSTGALVVSGGVGIANNLYVGGLVGITSTVDTSTSNAGALQVAGGAAISKNLHVGGFDNTALVLDGPTSGRLGFIKRAGGGPRLATATGTSIFLSVSSQANLLQNIATATFTDVMLVGINGVTVQTTIDSSSVTTGTLQIRGGAGISKSVFIGGNLSVKSTSWTSTGNDVFINAATNSLYLRNTVDAVAGQFESTVTDFNFRSTTATSYNILNINKPSGVVLISTTTNSTGAGSGALQVAGGMYVDKNAYVHGNLTVDGNISSGAESIVFTGTVDSTTTANGALVVAGGIGIAKHGRFGSGVSTNMTPFTGATTLGQFLNVGDALFTDNSTAAAGTVAAWSSARIQAGSVAATNTGVTYTDVSSLFIAGPPTAGANVTITRAYSINVASGVAYFGDTAQTTSSTTGSLVVAGGIGVGKNLRVAGDTFLAQDDNNFFASMSGGVNPLLQFNTNSYILYHRANSEFQFSTGDQLSLYVRTTHVHIPLATDSSSTDSGALQVVGGAGIAKSVFIGGDVNVKSTSWTSTGNDVYLNAATSTLYLRNTKDTVAGQFESSVTDFNFRSTTATSYDILNIHKPDGIVRINTTTDSTDTATGALIVAGGFAAGGNATIGGDLYVAGAFSSGSGGIDFNSTLDSTSPETGAVMIAGGLGVAKHLNVGYGLTVNQYAYGYAPRMGQFLMVGSGTATPTFTDNATAVNGTVADWSGTHIYSSTVAATNTGITYSSASSFYVSGAPVAGTNVTMTDAYAMYIASGRTFLADTTQSTSPTTGALIVTGGAGVLGNVNVGGNLSISGDITGISGTVAFTNTTDSSSSTTGSITIAGGVGIAKSLYIGSTLNVASGGNFGGNITMTGANPLFTFNNSAGLGLPTFDTRSTGTRILLYNALGATSVDWAVGISTDTLWHSIPAAVGTNFFRWYGGTTSLMQLSGAGDLTLTATTNSTSSTTGTLKVAGGIGVGGNVHVNGTIRVQWSAPSPYLRLLRNDGAELFLIESQNTGFNSYTRFVMPPSAGGKLVFNAGTNGDYIEFNYFGSVINSTLNVANTADATSAITGALRTAGSLSVTKNIWVGENIRVLDTKSVHFGYNVVGKETNAGRIGYQIATVGALDIFGAGATAGSRKIVLWDDVTVNNSLLISGTTPSTSPTTGALTLLGGLGVGNNVYVGGLLNVANTATIQGALIASSTATVSGVLTVANTTNSTNPATGAIVTTGGLGVALNTNLGGTLNVAGAGTFTSSVSIAGITNITNSTDSTAPNNGAFIVQGGAGIGLNLNVGGNLGVNGNTVIAGNLTVRGVRTEVAVQSLTVNDNVIVVNAAPGGTSDSGYAMKRWQYANDGGLGDIVNQDTPDFTGTATGGTATTVTLPATASAVDGYYNGAWIRITSGTGVGQVRRIASYNGTTKVATIYTTTDQATIVPTPDPVEGMDFTTPPTATSGYQLFFGQYILTYYDEQYREYTMGYTPINPTGNSAQPVTGAVDVFRRIGVHAGNLRLDRDLAVDVINESTPNAGVTVEGVLVKDNAMTGVTFMNGAQVDYYGTVQLTDDLLDSVSIPGTTTGGAYVIMVQDQIASGSSAVFVVCGSTTRGGSVNRLVSTLGSKMEHLSIIWNIGSVPKLYWLRIPATPTPLTTYRVKVIRM